MTIIVLWILLGIIALVVIFLHFSIIAEIKAEGTDVDIKVKYLFFTVYPRKNKRKNKSRKKSNLKEDKSEKFFDDFDDDLEEDLQMAEELPETFESNENVTAVSENTDEETIILDDNLENIFEEGFEDTASEKIPVKKRRVSEKLKKKKKPKKSKPEKEEGKFSELKRKYQTIKPYIPMGWKYFKKLLKRIRICINDVDLAVGKEDAYDAAMNYGRFQGALFNGIALISHIFTVKIKRTDVKCVFNENVFKYKADVTVRVRPSAVIAIAFCLLISFLRKFLPQFIRKKWNIRKKRKAAEKKYKAKTAAVNNL